MVRKPRRYVRPSASYRNGLIAIDTVVPGAGWVDVDYLGIDQGPIVAMIENHRSDLVWRVMRRSAYLRRALARAGFSGGWLEEQPR